MANLNVLKATQLEKSLGKSIYSKHKKIVDNYIISNLKNDGFFNIPVVEVITSYSAKLRENLINLYESKILTNTSHISDDIKILQASAFDGILCGLNVEKNYELNIFTANPKAIFGLDDDSKFSIEKTLKLNEQGIIHAVRIDVEYTDSEGFMFKPVSLNKNTNITPIDLEVLQSGGISNGRYFLIPYIVIQRSMAFFKGVLDDGRILKVTQEKGSLQKERYISANSTELAKYCDSESFARQLKPEYFPLKGFFYAPVLGSSSLTVGRTRIDLIDVCKIEGVTKPKIDIPKNYINQYLEDNSIKPLLTELYNSDIHKYCDVISKLPIDKGVISSDIPEPLEILKYTRQVSKAVRDKIIKGIPNIDNYIATRSNIITECTEYNIDDFSIDSLKDALKEGVFRFIIRKKNCEYSSYIVTNNKRVLRALYGDNYFAEYESLGVKLYKLERLFDSEKGISDESIAKELKYCGFPNDEDTVVNVRDIIENHNPEQSTHERLAELFTGITTRKTTRKSSSNESIITSRGCFATKSKGETLEYYKSIDIGKVISIYKLG